MPSPRACSLALALAAAGACAGRDTQASRDAFKSAVARGDAGQGGAAKGRDRTGRSPSAIDATTWKQLATFTADAADMLSLGTTTVSLPALIEKLCAEPPEERRAGVDLDAVRCPPEPALDPLGHALTLELGRGATLGLVAADLSDSDSADLLQQALRQLAGVCGRPWTQIPRRADDAHAEFHTCTATTGPTIALGRFPIDLAAGRWQFSISVLGPG
jgi:hypothetical protein